MPPSAVKTIRDLLYWQYAKIIAESAHFGKQNFSFMMSKFKALQSGQIHWSGSIREYIREHELSNQCIYCGQDSKLTLEHILPRSRGGEDNPDNVVWVCRSCNSEKGSKRLYEWKGLENKDKHHRIAEGKYLKYLFARHEDNSTLECSSVQELCTRCDMADLCRKENSVGKLSVYCLEGCFSKKK
jgi:hypothetical protein